MPEMTITDITADRQRLIYSGKVLKDDDTLETCKIAEGHTVHMVRSLARGGGNFGTNTNNSFSGGGNNSIPNWNQTENILNNSALMQYIVQLMQDPQFTDNVIAMNPQLASMAPQLRQVTQDPEFHSLLSNPESIRRTATLSSLMGNPGSYGPSMLPTNPSTMNPTTDTTNTPSTNNNDNNVPPQTTIPQQPEERFQVQLQQLNDMGFWDAQKNIRALLASGGNSIKEIHENWGDYSKE
ncbi:2596_t:CDS:2 [Entrophospora sp. SA101]|nr:2596_t:CDS:2 [Entrophospora sp. SA101]CAJ0846917.1 20549_t:CDS:2 [Entrophospora sp. SA101]